MSGWKRILFWGSAIVAGLLVAWVANASAQTQNGGSGNDQLNMNTSTATGGAGGAGGEAIQDQFQDQSQSQTQSSANTNTNSASNANTNSATGGSHSQSVKITTPRQAPAIGLGGLVASPETCMGSAGVIAGTPFGSLGLSKTYKDEECELRMFARSLSMLGQDEAALALLATNDKVAAALWAVGFKAAWLDGKERVRFAKMPTPSKGDILNPGSRERVTRAEERQGP